MEQIDKDLVFTERTKIDVATFLQDYFADNFQQMSFVDFSIQEDTLQITVTFNGDLPCG